jgi:fatty-acyl-CoA synthase
MGPLLSMGDVLSAHARVYPDRIGTRDLSRSMTFREWNARSCRLANALLGIGLRKGDRVGVLAYNCVEWMEIYASVAKAGLVAVPINFRLVGREIRYIIENCEARALILQDDLLAPIEEIRKDISIDKFIHFGAGRTPAGYLNRNDAALLAMPMCHANSLYFASTLTYCGGGVSVYNRKSFDPDHFLRTISQGGESFTSLVPTHYVMMLNLPAAVRDSCETGRVTKLMISSAPARQDTKRKIMAFFQNSGLFELYGSTEAGWVTMLHPDEQFTKLGSVGRECVGSAPIKLLDDSGQEVPEGEVGELYSQTPYTFDGYWKLPEKTRDSFRGTHCTVGDMARRDEDGFYYLVDRKSNMIISGGENVYPSEVEEVLGSHPAVKEVAVIGLPDAKWGERVHGVVVLREGVGTLETELMAWCRERLAGYKRPRSIAIIPDEEMPRTATGKVQHRILKSRIAQTQPAN